MKTLSVKSETRYKLGFLRQREETLQDTIERLIDSDIKRLDLKIPEFKE